MKIRKEAKLMTFKELQSLIEKYNIPEDVHLTSDSGWECDATEMNGVFTIERKMR